ncbi:MAG: aldehyde dehydrogenase family protein [Verrucomicrobiota bacterium]
MKPALLLVDLQRDFLAGSKLEPAADVVVSEAAALLAGCRDRRVPVVHVWTTLRQGEDRRLPHWKQRGVWQCVEGTPGHETPTELRPAPGEPLVHKTGFNAFQANLDSVLKQLGCDTLLLAGVHLHTCVRLAATEALERGLAVFICDKATGSNDPAHAAAVRRWLSEREVRFVSAAAWFAGLDGRESPAFVHRSPGDLSRELFEVRDSSAAEIANAASAAAAAQKDWRRMPLPEKCSILARLAEELEAAAPEFARRMAVEIGKPISQGLEEMRRAAANARDVLRRAAAFPFDSRESSGRARHLPLGTVAVISPWNNPVAIAIGKLAPALVYGNAVVWKPAPAATEISRALLPILARAGVPDGLVNLAAGGSETALRIAGQPAIDAVTVTGSPAAGWALQEICTRRHLPFQAELGGNNAAIVWDGADSDRAADELARGAFGFAGQRCTANRRVIVRSELFESFTDRLRAAGARLPWGDPLEPETVIGPVLDAGKRDEHVRRVRAAAAAGSEAHWLQSRRASEPWRDRGAYAQPALVICRDPAAPIVQEEAMSPVLVAQPAGEFEEALALCNGVRHGLAAALFSPDPGLWERFQFEAHAGILKWNRSTAGADVSLPFGGWKASGLGPPEHGESDVHFYTRPQAVYEADPL